MPLLKNRNFLLLRTGWSVSALGTQLQAFIFSLYILQITGSAMRFALTLCLEIVPSLLMAPFSGYAADRFDRKRQIVFYDLAGIAVTLVFFGVYTAAGKLSEAGIYTCVVLLAALQEFTSSAASGLMQASVPRRDVTAQQSVGSVLNSLTAVASPVLGGILFGAVGVGGALLCNAGSFLACAVLESRVHLPREALQGKTGQAGGVKAFFAAQREAAVYIRESRFLRSFLLIVVMLNFIVPSTSVGLMLVLQKRFGMHAFLLGAAEAAVALGMVAGALLAGLFAGRVEKAGISHMLFFATIPVLAAFACAGAYLFWGIGIMPPVAGLSLFVACHAVVAACCGFDSVHISGAFQKQVAPEIIGRVSALSGAASVCAAPLGQVAAGALLSVFPYGGMYAAESAFSAAALFFMRRFGRGPAESVIIKENGHSEKKTISGQAG